MKDKGTLVVISGFSGAGKGTVSKALVEKFGYSLSVSATTRQPREGEQDGREYYFKSEDDFLRLIDYNGFIEYAQYVDHYYGTPRKFVEDELAAGHVVILEIEVQGAMKIKEQYPDMPIVLHFMKEYTRISPKSPMTYLDWADKYKYPVRHFNEYGTWLEGEEEVHDYTK